MPLPLRTRRSLVPGSRVELGHALIDPAALQALIALTNELHPIHADLAFARASPMDGLIVPGVVLWELARVLSAERLGELAWTGAWRLSADYLRALRAGARVALSEECLAVSSAGEARLRWRAVDDAGDVIALAVRVGIVAP